MAVTTMFARLKNMLAKLENHHLVITNCPTCRYYEERMIDGIIHYRLSPDAAYIKLTIYQLLQLIYYRGKDRIRGLCRVLVGLWLMLAMIGE